MPPNILTFGKSSTLNSFSPIKSDRPFPVSNRKLSPEYPHLRGFSAAQRLPKNLTSTSEGCFTTELGDQKYRLPNSLTLVRQASSRAYLSTSAAVKGGAELPQSLTVDVSPLKKRAYLAPCPRKTSPWGLVFSRVASPKASDTPNPGRKHGGLTVPKALTPRFPHAPGIFYVPRAARLRLVPQNLTFAQTAFCKRLLNPLTVRPAAPHPRPRTPSLNHPASPHHDSRKASPDSPETLAW